MDCSGRFLASLEKTASQAIGKERHLSAVSPPINASSLSQVARHASYFVQSTSVERSETSVSIENCRDVACHVSFSVIGVAFFFKIENCSNSEPKNFFLIFRELHFIKKNIFPVIFY